MQAARCRIDGGRELVEGLVMSEAIHIDAEPGSIASTVLLPGDPLRARALAEGLLGDVRQVAGRRNMLGFTGTWRGARVSVMGSGMGMASCAIYVTELARFFGVRRIVRLGTCAGIRVERASPLGDDVGLGRIELGDILIAQAASTDSSFNRHGFGGLDLGVCADFGLLRSLVDSLATGSMKSGLMGSASMGSASMGSGAGRPARVVNVFSTDSFYGGVPGLCGLLARHRIAGVEMETAGLYGVAMREGFAAASVLMVSDLLGLEGPIGVGLDGEKRERGLTSVGRWVLEGLFPRS